MGPGISKQEPRQFIAVTGGSVGGHPLDPRTWSGLSRSFFSELQRRGRLRRGFTAEPSRSEMFLYRLKNFHPDRRKWRKQFYMDVGYRAALTRGVEAGIRSDDLDCDFVQIGAMLNSAEATRGQVPCYSYSDSSVAESVRNPYAPKGLGAKRIDRVIAHEKRVYHAMTKVFTCGHYLRDSLIRDYDLPSDHVVTIGAGVVLDEIPEADPHKRYDRREILMLGADFQRKGGWELLQALKIVREKLSGTILHVIGPSALDVPVPLGEGVVFHGFLDKGKPDEWQELQNIVARCSLFALPSHYEPFGVAPLEAMVHQIPCVVSNIGAMKETVTRGKTGELVEPGDVEGLAETVYRLLSDPETLKRMGMAGRQRVIEWYTWDRVVDRFLTAVDRP